MSSNKARSDLRLPAVAASEALRRTLPSGLSPEKGGISYCLERAPSLSRLRAPIKVTAVVSGLVGLSGIATGGVIGVLMTRHILAYDPGLLAFAVCCSVGGLLLMFVPTFVERGIVRRHLSRNDEEFDSASKVKGIHVSLEYAPTYGSIKILAEDVGLLYIHPESHYIRMDGLSYEYVIQSKHVVGLSLHSNRKSVLLSYAIGEEQLDLVIAPRSVLAEFMRQTFGSSRSLWVKIEDALRPDA